MPPLHDGLDIGGRPGPHTCRRFGHGHLRGLEKAGTDGAAGGIVVWISHGGGTLYTTYNHLSAVTVKIGQHVTAVSVSAAWAKRVRQPVRICISKCGSATVVGREYQLRSQPLLYVSPSRH